MSNVKQDILVVTLASLLGDLGPFARRSGLFDRRQTSTPAELIRAAGWQSLLPARALEVMADENAHPQAKNERVERAVRIALHLIGGEQRRGDSSESDPTETPLVPLLGEVALSAPVRRTGQGYALTHSA